MSDLLINNPAMGPGNSIYFAKVTRFYASSNLVDAVTIDDNIALLGCQILCSMPAGFVFGEKYTPSYDDSNKETSYVMSPADVYCVATFIDDYQQPVILGFLFPKETTLSIADYGLYIFRHESDVMWMIRGDGTIQVYHPSGSIIKIGSDDVDEMTNDLMIPTTTKSFYRRDSTEYVSNKSTSLYIKWHAGQAISLESDGNLTIKTSENKATLIMTPEGALSIETESDINISSQATLNLVTNPAPGNLTINGVAGVTGVHTHAGMTVSTTQGIVTAIS